MRPLTSSLIGSLRSSRRVLMVALHRAKASSNKSTSRTSCVVHRML